MEEEKEWKPQEPQSQQDESMEAPIEKKVEVEEVP